MLLANASFILSVTFAAQWIGLGCAVWARLAEGTPQESRSQACFFAALLFVGGSTAASFAVDDGMWWLHASTLTVMSIGATLDLRKSVEIAQF